MALFCASRISIRMALSVPMTTERIKRMTRQDRNLCYFGPGAAHSGCSSIVRHRTSLVSVPGPSPGHRGPSPETSNRLAVWFGHLDGLFVPSPWIPANVTSELCPVPPSLAGFSAIFL